MDEARREALSTPPDFRKFLRFWFCIGRLFWLIVDYSGIFPNFMAAITPPSIRKSLPVTNPESGLSR